MSFNCLTPSLAVCMFTDQDGKQHLKFIKRAGEDLKKLREKYGSDNVYQLPCGKCEQCRRQYADDWAIRCQLEAQYYDYVYFITLTYSDNFLNSASHHDFKRFIEKLQGSYHEFKIAYFACKEYGSITHRLHYHVVLFMPYELDLYDKTKLGKYFYYHSKSISKAWPFGHHNVAKFESSCARYVAKYCNKPGSDIYMSRNIGKRYFYDNYKKIIADKFQLYGDFGKDKKHVSIPRSMFYWFKDVDCSEVDEWKNIKKEIAKAFIYSKARDLEAKYEDEVIAAIHHEFERSNKFIKERRD